MTDERPEANEVDEVIREVREVRERLWREGGGTAQGFFSLMDRMSEEREARKRTPAPVKRKKSA